MKKVTLIVVATVLGISAVAQRIPRIDRGVLTDVLIKTETQKLQAARNAAGLTYVEVHPLEYIAVNVYKRKADSVSWNTPTTGWRIDYGDSTWLNIPVPPNYGPTLRLFSELANSGDVTIIAGPTGMFATFSIFQPNEFFPYFIMARKPWPSQKAAKFDTCQIFTGGSGPHYSGVYKYKFFVNMRSEHVSYAKLVDRYLGREYRFGIKDTFEHVFNINASDPDSTLSKMPHRFLIIAAKPLPVLGLPVVAPPISVAPRAEEPMLTIQATPNPVATGGTVWVRCQESYDRAECTVHDMFTEQILQRVTFSGGVCQLNLLPSITRGVYIVKVQPRGNVPSMVTKLQVDRY